MIYHQRPSRRLQVFCLLTFASILLPIMAIVASGNAHAQGSLSWNTFRGGPGDDFGNAIAADRHGYIYLTGDFKIGDYTYAFVSKIDPRGVKVWDKILGSSSANDSGTDVAVDSGGNVYVVGGSDANWSSPARAHSGSGKDAFIAILNSDGGLLWHTFLGTANNYDVAKAITLDSNSNIYVAGDSHADWGWAITKNRHAGNQDLFALKMSATGVVFWHTFMGSSDDDACTGITRDRNGNVYLSGQGKATWGTPRRGYSGGADAVVIKLNGSGNYQWHTFLGSSASDTSYAISTNTTGNIYTSGGSYSSWGTPLNAYQGSSDGFVAKLNSSGNRLWNTFIGSTGHDDAFGMALDSRGSVYVTGWSTSSWGNPQNTFSGTSDAFVTQLNPLGVRIWNTFLGGPKPAVAIDIAVNGGNIVIAGASAAWGTPVTAHSGNWDAFAAKLRVGGTALPPILLLLND